MTYVKQFRRSSYRAKCKSCYTNWIARQANVSARRVEAYFEKSKQRSIHLILTVPENQRELPVKLLRQRMSPILNLGNIKGGAAILHPFEKLQVDSNFQNP